MQTINGILATGYSGPGNSPGGSDALQSMIESIHARYYPIEFDYDPRKPHQGRWIQAELTHLDDGTPAVNATGEIFESGDAPAYDSKSNRQLALPVYLENKWQVQVDQHFNACDARSLLEKLSQLWQTDLRREVRKYTSPLRILTLGTQLTEQTLPKSPFESFNAEQKKNCLDILDDLLTLPLQSGQDQLLKVTLNLMTGKSLRNLTLLYEHPVPDLFEEIIHQGLGSNLADQVTLLETHPEISQLVCKVSSAKAEVLYGVRQDAVPLTDL